jgi:hypothetical protein
MAEHCRATFESNRYLMQTESLDFYWKLAKKLIMVHGHAGLLRDDENIGYVANAVMNADISFNPKVGVIEGYRSMHGKFAVLKLIKKHRNKVKVKNIDTKKFDTPYKDNFENVVDCAEIFEFVSKANLVSDIVLEQIKDRFIRSFTWNEIGVKHKISKERAKLNVDNGMSAIRKKLYR